MTYNICIYAVNESKYVFKELLQKIVPVLKKAFWTLTTIVCLVLSIKTSNDPAFAIYKNAWFGELFKPLPMGNAIIFNLVIGFLVSGIFYILVVWIPERRRRKIIRKNVTAEYHLFKESIISILLRDCNAGGGGRYDSRTIPKLTEQDAFRKHFHESISESQHRWHAVLNGLNEGLLEELLTELDVFINDVSFVINNVNIDDEQVFSFFKRFASTVSRLRGTTLEYNDIKQLSDFIWTMFAGWTWGQGYRKEKIVKVMIEKI